MVIRPASPGPWEGRTGESGNPGPNTRHAGVSVIPDPSLQAHVLLTLEGQGAWACRAAPQLLGPQPGLSFAGCGTPGVGLGSTGKSTQGCLCGEQPVGGSWHSDEGGTAFPLGPHHPSAAPSVRCQLGGLQPWCLLCARCPLACLAPSPETLGFASAVSSPAAQLRKLRPRGVVRWHVATWSAPIQIQVSTALSGNLCCLSV